MAPPGRSGNTSAWRPDTPPVSVSPAVTQSVHNRNRLHPVQTGSDRLYLDTAGSRRLTADLTRKAQPQRTFITTGDATHQRYLKWRSDLTGYVHRYLLRRNVHTSWGVRRRACRVLKWRQRRGSVAPGQSGRGACESACLGDASDSRWNRGLLLRSRSLPGVATCASTSAAATGAVFSCVLAGFSTVRYQLVQRHTVVCYHSLPHVPLARFDAF